MFNTFALKRSISANISFLSHSYLSSARRGGLIVELFYFHRSINFTIWGR